MAELQPIIVFHGRHFVCHLCIFSRIYVKLLQLISGIIPHKSVKNEISILINGWVTVNYCVLQPPFCPPSWCHSAQFKKKRRLCLKPLSWRPQTRHTHRHTDTQTHIYMSIAIGEMQFVLSLIILRSTMLGVNIKSNKRAVAFWWGGGREWLSAVNRTKVCNKQVCLAEWVKCERAIIIFK